MYLTVIFDSGESMTWTVLDGSSLASSEGRLVVHHDWSRIALFSDRSIKGAVLHEIANDDSGVVYSENDYVEPAPESVAPPYASYEVPPSPEPDPALGQILSRLDDIEKKVEEAPPSPVVKKAKAVTKLTKSPYKTSEFWITAATMAGAAATSIAGVLPEKYAAMVAGAAGVAYTAARGMTKWKAGKALEPPTEGGEANAT